MTVRDFRAIDAPQLREFLMRDFPEEKEIMGMRPEGFDRIVRRIFRWDARFVLGLFRLVGRPVFRFFVVEQDHRLIATTLLTFGGRTGYISTVAVDPAHRRHGYARLLLERSRQATVARGRPYVALDVRELNTPARALYDSLGYRPLRRTFTLVHSEPARVGTGPATVRGLRAFRPADAAPLAEIVRAEKPPEVEAVLPTSAREITGSDWVGRMLESDSAAWVIDEGAGPVAWVSATVSPADEAGHLNAPIVAPAADPAAAQGLVETALAWCAARRSPRVAAMLPEENRRGREALTAAGFHDGIALWTLYRPAA
jgi:ribosomal protein S18 acetylase RimI-like enzyme